MEVGVLSLGDLQRDQRTGRLNRPVDRMAQILGYAVLADQMGLDVFAVGEHHSPEFFTSSPAVVLAAVAARTAGIRLTSATTLLGVADPVRVYEDFASLDVISRGRAEIIAGRSAFAEPFALFGYDTADYDALFAEKLGLLLDIRAAQTVTWSGRFRPPLDAAAVVPRAVQDRLPVWVGVGGSPGSAERAGQLGLPMVLGYIGGTLAHLRPLVDAYRAAGERAGHAGALKVAISTHFHAGADPAKARAVYPYYHEYLRPKKPGGRGFTVSQAAFDAGTSRQGAIMIGSADEITGKLLDAVKALSLDRIFAQVDWGGLPSGLVEESIARYATEIAPALRAA
ncbi:MAG: LLM class flavin-dependent oxidoreductase [Streptosporangiaceae bacterium]|jgi:alkanesulfonate monooxygenase SsuD/methylene tetrahydromethanopterin reductase-like flavin-dependent oxidoreductase (luciferase family)